MPPKPVPQMQAPQVTQGRLEAVPCPFCKKPMDFRPHVGEDAGGTGWGEQGLEGGAMVDCDECGSTSKILAKEKIIIVRLQPIKRYQG